MVRKSSTTRTQRNKKKTRVNKMKTLQAIVLATAIGASACGQVDDGSRPGTPVEVVGTPIVEPERTDSGAWGSYTFLLRITAPEPAIACAYRSGKDACEEMRAKERRDLYDIAQQLEYESIIVKSAAREKVPVSFESAGKTPQGCYIIRSVPKLR